MRLAIASGDNQTGPVGTQLPLPLVVSVKDPTGQPLANKSVTFSVTGGSLTGTIGTTTSQGLAQTNLTLSSLAGQNTVTASVTDASPSSVTFHAAATSSTQVASLFVSGLPSQVTAGSANALVVTARTSDGNTATGYAGAVLLTSTDPGAILPASYTFQTADAGVHTFPGIVLNTMGTQTITVTDTATSSLAGSQTVYVGAGAAAKLVVYGIANPFNSGAVSDVYVAAKDAHGNTATAYSGTIAFSSTDGGATLPASYAFTLADQGVHCFPQGVKLVAAGSTIVTATDTLLPSVTGSQTVAVVSVERVTSFTSAKSRVPFGSTVGLSWSTAGAPTTLTLQPGSIDETGKATETVTPFPTVPTTPDPRAWYKLVATTPTNTGENSEVVRALEAGGPTEDQGLAVAAMPDGGYVVAGTFTTTASFSIDTNLLSNGGKDGFVARYSSTGALVWAAQMGGPADDYAQSVCGLQDGSVLVCGSFAGTASFSATVSLASAGGTDAFVAHYKSDGSLDWATRAGGAGDDQGLALAGLPDGSSVVVGAFTGSATFGTTSLTSAGSSDVFVARFRSDGSIAWAKSAGGSGEDRALGAAALADGSVLVTGFFNGSATFGATILTSAGGKNVFVARFGSQGSVISALQAGGAGDSIGQAMATASDGTSFVVGSFTGSATFGATALTSSGGKDAFVAKLATDGSIAWAKNAGGTGEDVALGVGAFPDGSAIVAGSFQGSATFGATTLSSAGANDVFIAHYKADGSVTWAASAGGTGDDQGTAVASFPDGGFALTGSFSGTAVLASGVSLSSRGGQDALVAKYGAVNYAILEMRPEGMCFAKQTSGSSPGSKGYACVSYTDGSTAVTGSYAKTVTFGPSSTLTAFGTQDAFVARYTANGTLSWVKDAGNSGTAEGLAVAALDNGRTLVVGDFTGSAVFGRGEPAQTTLTASGTTKQAFVALYGSDGKLVWAKQTTGATLAVAQGVSAYSDGKCVVTGYFTGTATFGTGVSLTATTGSTGTTTDPSTGSTSTSSSSSPSLFAASSDAAAPAPSPTPVPPVKGSGGQNVFVVRYDATGAAVWAASAGDTDKSAWGQAISSVPDGTSICVGYFATKATFGKGETNETTLTASGGNDVFVARYKDDGKLSWAKIAGGTADDRAQAVVAQSDGSSYVTGFFGGSATFGTVSLTAVGASDVFLARVKSDGTFDWAKKASGSGSTDVAQANALTVLADGTIGVVGGFKGSVTFGSTTLTTSGGAQNAFFSRFASDGTASDARKCASSADGSALGVGAIFDGSIVWTGSFKGSTTFGSGEPQTTVLTATGLVFEAFVAKCFPYVP